MTSARRSTLASLQGAISRLEADTMPQAAERVALGHAEADAMLQGGLMRGVLHEVFALETRQAVSLRVIHLGAGGFKDQNSPPRGAALLDFQLALGAIHGFAVGNRVMQGENGLRYMEQVFDH